MARQAYISESQEKHRATAMDGGRGAIVRRGLALFDLAPLDYSASGAIAESLQNAAAIYSPEDKQIVVLLPTDDVFVLVHEYVHALQDAAGLLAPVFEPTTDALLANRALLEGEAYLIQLAAEAAALGFSPQDVQWQPHLDVAARTNRAALIRSPHIAEDVYAAFVYSHGARFLLPQWRSTGYRRIFPEQRPLPNNTRQILAGAAAPAPPNEGWKQDLDIDVVPVLASSSHRLVLRDSLGQQVWSTFWNRLARSRREGCALWSPIEIVGDSFTVLHDPTNDEVVAAWVVRAASVSGIPKSAANDTYALPQDLPLITASFTACFAGRANVVAESSGTYLRIVISDRATRTLALSGWSSEQNVPLLPTDGGVPAPDAEVPTD